MNLKLETDFFDYYDHYFCSSAVKPDYTVRRIAHGRTMPKWEQFRIMREAGLNVPLNGFAYDLNWDKTHPVVLYSDPYLHQGDGKELTNFGVVKPDQFVADYIQSRSGAATIRFLCVGMLNTFLTYKSLTDDWRSNVGEVLIEHRGEDWLANLPSAVYNLPYPIYAIDFVHSIGGNLWAVDFNTAPQVKGTGIEDEITPKQLYRFIEDWYVEQRLQSA